MLLTLQPVRLLPDNCIDIVICFNSFHNFDCPALALKEMHRVLKTGGKLSIGFNEPLINIENKFYLPADKLNNRMLSLSNLIPIISRTGLGIESALFSDSFFLINMLKQYKSTNNDKSLIKYSIN